MVQETIIEDSTFPEQAVHEIIIKDGTVTHIGGGHYNGYIQGSCQFEILYFGTINILHPQYVDKGREGRSPTPKHFVEVIYKGEYLERTKSNNLINALTLLHLQ